MKKQYFYIYCILVFSHTEKVEFKDFPQLLKICAAKKLY